MGEHQSWYNLTYYVVRNVLLRILNDMSQDRSRPNHSLLSPTLIEDTLYNAPTNISVVNGEPREYLPPKQLPIQQLSIDEWKDRLGGSLVCIDLGFDTESTGTPERSWDTVENGEWRGGVPSFLKNQCRQVQEEHDEELENIVHHCIPPVSFSGE